MAGPSDEVAGSTGPSSMPAVENTVPAWAYRSAGARAGSVASWAIIGSELRSTSTNIVPAATSSTLRSPVRRRSTTRGRPVTSTGSVVRTGVSGSSTRNRPDAVVTVSHVPFPSDRVDHHVMAAAPSATTTRTGRSSRATERRRRVGAEGTGAGAMGAGTGDGPAPRPGGTGAAPHPARFGAAVGSTGGPNRDGGAETIAVPHSGHEVTDGSTAA